MTVGERIKELRNKLNMSQVDFADKINVSKQTLYKYENNIITNIPSDKIEAAANLGNISPAYLMGWENPDILVTLENGEQVLIETYRKLPESSQRKLEKYATMLSGLYSMEEPLLNAAHERVDIKVTDEMRKHDDDIMDSDDF